MAHSARLPDSECRSFLRLRENMTGYVAVRWNPREDWHTRMPLAVPPPRGSMESTSNRRSAFRSEFSLTRSSGSTPRRGWVARAALVPRSSLPNLESRHLIVHPFARVSFPRRASGPGGPAALHLRHTAAAPPHSRRRPPVPSPRLIRSCTSILEQRTCHHQDQRLPRRQPGAQPRVRRPATRAPSACESGAPLFERSPTVNAVDDFRES